jgi:hypothetical protein
VEIAQPADDPPERATCIFARGVATAHDVEEREVVRWGVDAGEEREDVLV